MTEAELLAECEHELYPLLVSDHAAHPVYVMPLDRVADMPRIDAYGWASAGLFMDPNLIDRIDDYRGPGTVIMMDAISIGEDAAPGCFERCYRGVFIHELGHRPLVPPLLPPDTDRARDVALRAMTRQSVSAEPESFTPADSHDLQFIRQTTHLAFRGIVSGVDFTTHRLFGPPEKCFAPFERYLIALLPECVHMADATFAEIDAVDPPPAFLAQYEADKKLAITQRQLREMNQCQTAST